MQVQGMWLTYFCILIFCSFFTIWNNCVMICHNNDIILWIVCWFWLFRKWFLVCWLWMQWIYLDFFLSKYLPFVNNVIGFSFSKFDFNVNYSCLMFNILNYRFRFGMSHWIEMKPSHEKRKHEKSNETCCSLNLISL